jgi:hypothetical protein
MRHLPACLPACGRRAAWWPRSCSGLRLPRGGASNAYAIACASSPPPHADLSRSHSAAPLSVSRRALQESTEHRRPFVEGPRIAATALQLYGSYEPDHINGTNLISTINNHRHHHRAGFLMTSSIWLDYWAPVHSSAIDCTVQISRFE